MELPLAKCLAPPLTTATPHKTLPSVFTKTQQLKSAYQLASSTQSFWVSNNPKIANQTNTIQSAIAMNLSNKKLKKYGGRVFALTYDFLKISLASHKCPKVSPAKNIKLCSGMDKPNKVHDTSKQLPGEDNTSFKASRAGTVCIK